MRLCLSDFNNSDNSAVSVNEKKKLTTVKLNGDQFLGKSGITAYDNSKKKGVTWKLGVSLSQNLISIFFSNYKIFIRALWKFCRGETFPKIAPNLALVGRNWPNVDCFLQLGKSMHILWQIYEWKNYIQ